MEHFPKYSRHLVYVARTLRRRMTDAERVLWPRLRETELAMKFRRQFPFGKHILDFYCHQARLNVEVDGGHHYTDEGTGENEERDAKLEQDGIKVMRFSNSEDMEEIDSVVDAIFEEVHRRIRVEAGGKGGA